MDTDDLSAEKWAKHTFARFNLIRGDVRLEQSCLQVAFESHSKAVVEACRKAALSGSKTMDAAPHSDSWRTGYMIARRDITQALAGVGEE